MFEIGHLKRIAIGFLISAGVISKRSTIVIKDIPVLNTGDLREAYLILSTSNNIVKLQLSNGVFYFRHCNQFVKKRELLQHTFDDYSNFVGGDTSKLIQSLLSDVIVRKFLNLGAIEDTSSRVFRYFRDGDITLLGFEDSPKFGSDKQKFEFDAFIHYAWSEFDKYYINKHSGTYQLFHYDRSKSQQVIYGLFGVSRLICPIELVQLQTPDNHFLLGSLQKECAGINPVGFFNTLTPKTPSLFRDLDILNILDILCNERDHRPGNYNILFDSHKAVCSIRAFDNDSVMSFFPTLRIDRSSRGEDSIIDTNGFIARRFIDKKFAQQFLSISANDLGKAISPYLNELQIYALKKRFKKLQQAIEKTIKKRPDCLLDYDEKESLYIETEIKKFGRKTYYDILENYNEDKKDTVLVEQGQFPKRRIWECTCD